MKKIKNMSRLLSLLCYATCGIYLLLQIYSIFFQLDAAMSWVKPILGHDYNFSNLLLITYNLQSWSIYLSSLQLSLNTSKCFLLVILHSNIL